MLFPLQAVAQELQHQADAQGPVSLIQASEGAAANEVTFEQRAERQRAPAPAQKPAPDARAVRELQERLNVLGYDAGPVDGLLGPKTREAIETFRKTEGLDDAVTAPAELLPLAEAATGAVSILAPSGNPIGTPAESNVTTGATEAGFDIAAATLGPGETQTAYTGATPPDDLRGRSAPLAAEPPSRVVHPLDARALIGQTLVNRNGMKIGEIRNMLFERNGEVTALIVRVGGFRMLGEFFARLIGDPGRDISVPWSAIRVDGRGRILTGLSLDDAEAAPAYETPLETAAMGRLF